MTLTKEQIKIAKQFIKDNNICDKVEKEIGNGFWADKCGGTFEGYLSFLANHTVDTKAWINTFAASHARIMSGKAGASSL